MHRWSSGRAASFGRAVATTKRPLSRLVSCAPPCSWARGRYKYRPPLHRLHSVPRVQFQVLLTCLSAFFSTFVHTTSPLSVFVSYLDLAEIYLLFCPALTSKTTLEWAVIWGRALGSGDYHPLWCRVPTDFTLDAPHQPPPRKGHRGEPITEHPPFPLIFSRFVRHY